MSSHDNLSGSGRTALVTGAGSGMGRSTALAFLAAGYDVVLADVNIEGATAVAAEAPAGGGRAHAAQVDVRDRQSVKALLAAALDAFGSLDVAINFAGITGAGTTIVDTTEEHVRAIVDVNLLGVWHCMSEEIASMLQSGGGLVINAASAMALRAAPRSAAYAMAKAAVVHMSQTAALEYAADGVRVIALCPGPVNTPMYQANSEDVRKKIASGVPLGRPAESDEIAQAVLWLASPAAAYMTGTTFTLDGGDSA